MAKPDLLLPMAVEDLVPHRLPMRLVDRLLEEGDRAGTVECCLRAGAVVVDAAGRFDEAAFLELMAQAYAAVKGYDDARHDLPVQEGFLVGCREIRVCKPARAGQTLTVRVKTIATVDSFAVVDGEVWCGPELLATGTIKLWTLDREVRSK